MANPQVEEGAITIAYSLWLAFAQAELSGLQLRIIMVILLLTYGAGKTMADMTLDDIRYQLGGTPLVRPERAEKALEGLVNRNIIKQQGSALGLQKDYDQWVYSEGDDKMSRHINITKKYIYNYSCDDILSVPQILGNYVQAKSKLKLSNIKQIGIEQGNARRLYALATQLTLSPAEALLVVRDYLDFVLANDWVQLNVKMKFTYALSKFEAWYRAIPKKPKTVRDNEQVTGKRFRWSHESKRWEKTNDKI